MTHARRRFVEAFAMDGSAALTVGLIQQLYQVERAAVTSRRTRVGPGGKSTPSRSSRSSRPSAIGSP